MACAYITDLATNIWKNIGEPTDITVSYIQSKLVSEYFIGKLNNLLSTTYEIQNSDIVPALGNYEQAVYGLMYESDFYTNRIAKLLSGYSTITSWVELGDGDGRVRRTSPTEFARTLKDLKAQLDQGIIRMVHMYRMNNSLAQSVNYYTIDTIIPLDRYPINGYVYRNVP